jgi:hypothetical protein
LQQGADDRDELAAGDRLVQKGIGYSLAIGI